jgi:hypothetical protein
MVGPSLSVIWKYRVVEEKVRRSMTFLDVYQSPYTMIVESAITA